jgi:type IV secretion system protein VirB5
MRHFQHGFGTAKKTKNTEIYLKQSKGYGEFIEEATKKLRTSVFFNFFQLVINFLCIIGMFYVGTLPKSIPMVIQVQPWGEAQYLGDVSEYSYGKVPIEEKSIEFYLRYFVNNMYSLSTDPEVVMQNWRTAFSFISTSGYPQLEQLFRELKPLESVGTTRSIVEIESFIKITKNTYQIDWFVLSSEGSGSFATGGKRMRGIFTIIFAQPPKEKEKVNPLGIYVDSFNVVELGAVR